MIYYFDVDEFKSINDTYGHGEGDSMLSEVGGVIYASFSHVGHCYRIGGDEFCVILRRRVELLDKLNTTFQELIEQKHREDPRIPYVALGFAFFRFGISHIQAVVEEADAMMYQNKKKLHSDTEGERASG